MIAPAKTRIALAKTRNKKPAAVSRDGLLKSIIVMRYWIRPSQAWQ